MRQVSVAVKSVKKTTWRANYSHLGTKSKQEENSERDGRQRNTLRKEGKGDKISKRATQTARAYLCQHDEGSV